MKVWSRFRDAGVDLTGKSAAVLAAVILNFGIPYPDLEIARDYNCVYLAREGNDTTAWIKPNGVSHTCPETLNPPYTGAQRLDVMRDAALPGQYPVVARWHRHPTNGKYQIGLYCDGWCVVGKRPINVPAKYHANGSPKERRVFEVAGWFDEQHLAVPQPGGGNAPSNLFGSIFPAPLLGDFVVASFAAPRFLEVARIALSDDNEHYNTRLNLRKKSVTDPANEANLNVLRLCQGTRAACNVKLPAAGGPKCSWADPVAWRQEWTMGDTLWWASIDNGAGDPTFKCVMRREHPPGADIPGTARWRWQAKDETIWVRCDQGCCEVDQ